MRVGILGGGQLARMLALAGRPLGLEFAFLDPAADACAFSLGRAFHAAYDDPAALDALADWAEVVSFEFERVPAPVVERLAARVAVHPPAGALAAAQDRLIEKRLFRELGIDTPAFHPVDSRADLDQAARHCGLPLVLKTRRDGYDGKGQRVLRQPEELDAAWQSLGEVPLLAESFLPFDREISVLAVRAADGETRCYPLAENQHADGILIESRSRPADPRQEPAQAAARRLLERLDYVGVLALELFDCGGRLLANEFAPRVHNSGHWTIEGAETSQFENHLRAVCGLPLGETGPRGAVAMLNLIGTMPAAAELLALPGAHLHDYGKAPRSGRKLGHLSCWAPDEAALAPRLAAARQALGRAPRPVG